MSIFISFVTFSEVVLLKSFALVLPGFFRTLLRYRCHFFQNLIRTWSQNPIAIENTTCQCRTAFPHDDLTSYLWGLSIFRAKDKFTVRKTTRETLVQIKNIKFSKFLIFLLCLHLSPDSVSRAGYISNR